MDIIQTFNVVWVAIEEGKYVFLRGCELTWGVWILPRTLRHFSIGPLENDSNYESSSIRERESPLLRTFQVASPFSTKLCELSSSIRKVPGLISTSSVTSTAPTHPAYTRVTESNQKINACHIIANPNLVNSIQKIYSFPNHYDINPNI